ncbi:MAG: hypothetical protein U9O87_03625 [Verrucomicrobiota bacterium]|nr:hypothetical protein [Verrucomicrobiota bacterium]
MNFKLKEAEVACTAAEEKCSELEIDIALLQVQLNEARKKNAVIWQELKDVKRDLKSLNGSTAVLLLENDGLRQADAKTLSILFEYLNEKNSVFKSMAMRINNLIAFLESLATKKNNDTNPYRKKVLKELSSIQIELFALKESFNFANATNKKIRHCNVLAVQNELGIVVFDAGLMNGVTVKSVWEIQKNENVPEIMIQIIETRKLISAGIVIDGSLIDVKIGATATKSYGKKKNK